jgi:hypothetical protein
MLEENYQSWPLKESKNKLLAEWRKNNGKQMKPKGGGPCLIY